MPECSVCFYIHFCQTFAKVQLIVVTFFENLRFTIVYLLFFIKHVDELPPPGIIIVLFLCAHLIM